MEKHELSRDELVRLYDEYRVTEAASAVAAAGDSLWGGGALHIIIEDCNLEDSHIANCREQPDLKPEEAAWLDRFAQLDVEERAACIAIMDGNLADLCIKRTKPKARCEKSPQNFGAAHE